MQYAMSSSNESSPPSVIKARSYDVVTYHICKTYQYISIQASSQVLNALGGHLKAFIDNLYEVEINSSFMQSIMKSHFDVKSFRSKTEKDLLYKIEVVMKAAVVYYISLKNAAAPIVRTITAQEMIKEYPQFNLDSCDVSELQYMRNFCNAMKVAMTVISPRLNKKLLIDICAKLEGSGRSYVTGGCQHLFTERRVMIYEQESGIKPIPRPSRRTANSEEAEERKKKYRRLNDQAFHQVNNFNQETNKSSDALNQEDNKVVDLSHQDVQEQNDVSNQEEVIHKVQPMKENDSPNESSNDSSNHQLNEDDRSPSPPVK